MILKEEIEWKDCCRTKVLIITNEGKIYEDDCNHQYCLEQITMEYTKRVADEAETEYDYEESMMHITDRLFREGTIHGFDYFEGRDGRKFLASHYKRALDNALVCKAAKEYAKKNGCILATFFNPDKLGKEMRLVA